MDRRRRQNCGPFYKPPFRLPRRPLQLIRRQIDTRDWQYLLVALTLFLLFILLILTLTSDDDISVSYPSLLSRSVSTSKSHPVASFGTHAVTGSIHDLERLLRAVTNNSAHGNLVIAVAVNYAYRKLALNFVCNLKRLHLTNYIILAMDKAVYHYLAGRRAQVFFYDDAPRVSRRLLSESDTSAHESPRDKEDVFGTASFIETSRRKSLLVLKVLRLGYSVIFSDVDVVWIQNPVPHLLEYNSDFVIQSDRAHHNKDTALNYNINSGFYLVRSSKRAVTALQAIVKYASAIRRSEQKAFNYVLCGAFKDNHAGPGIRVGANECSYRSIGATAKLLSLEMFPNGSDQSLWSNSTTDFVQRYPKVVAVHANYVAGSFEKVQRIKDIGFWFHSEESLSIDECARRPDR